MAEKCCRVHLQLNNMPCAFILLVNQQLFVEHLPCPRWCFRREREQDRQDSYPDGSREGGYKQVSGNDNSVQSRMRRVRPRETGWLIRLTDTSSLTKRHLNWELKVWNILEHKRLKIFKKIDDRSLKKSGELIYLSTCHSASLWVEHPLAPRGTPFEKCRFERALCRYHFWIQTIPAEQSPVTLINDLKAHPPEGWRTQSLSPPIPGRVGGGDGSNYSGGDMLNYAFPVL